MRVRNSNDTLSVHAIAGTHVVLLGFDVWRGGCVVGFGVFFLSWGWAWGVF